MPPFKVGLMKRKLLSNNIGITSAEQETNFAEDEDLIGRKVIESKEDATDSEHEEDSDANSINSDSNTQEVLYGDSPDSTFGDEVSSKDASDESSELADSDDDDETGDSDVPGSVDSGAESGGVRSQGGAGRGAPRDAHGAQKRENKMRQKRGQQLKDSVSRLASKIKETNVSTEPVGHQDEYSSGDSSDEEDRRTTVGAVPRWWYDEYPHLGYDLDGRRLLKPPHRDAIDAFLKQCEDPEFWRTVRDPATGQDVVLAQQDLELLARLRAGQLPNPDHDEYQPWVEWFSREVLATPVRGFPEHKRSFLPSREEQRAIGRIVHALRMGWAKTRRQLADERRQRKEKKYYDLWGASTEEERVRGVHRHIPAPRRPPPGHAESYNPPPEYLLDDKEMKEWESLAETPWRRKYTFLPTQHAALRAVPAYPRLARERFLRCLDLYLAPRAIKMRLTLRPEELVPTLPAPRELRPFPTGEALRLTGHAAPVRSCDFDPTGQFIVSGSDDGTVKIWETSTGRCVRTVEVGGAVCRVVWAPARALPLVAAAVGRRLLLLSPGAPAAGPRAAADADRLFEEPPPQHDAAVDERTARAVQWERVRPEEWARGVRLAVTHFNPLQHISWHGRGDYVAATVREGGARAVAVHQLSRRRSQLPFSRAKGLVQCAVFHPHRPHLFVATQRAVRIYDLVKQELVKKLLTGAQWVSALAVHPAGDNLLVASYDRKCMWFDLELSSQPYQTLRLHGRAVRAVAFSARYPLFATGGDDPYLVVSHATVYNDLLQNPLLVPLKQLGVGAGREPCVLDLRWHPAQPWLLVAAADHTLRLFA